MEHGTPDPRDPESERPRATSCATSRSGRSSYFLIGLIVFGGVAPGRR